MKVKRGASPDFLHLPATVNSRFITFAVNIYTLNDLLYTAELLCSAADGEVNAQVCLVLN